ncbi:hypothetical protein TNCV_827601 [Trichonephila clavipes]|nr:hypothetical protein TNCV_827601 [Trichonephila clavipes]
MSSFTVILKRFLNFSWENRRYMRSSETWGSSFYDENFAPSNLKGACLLTDVETQAHVITESPKLFGVQFKIFQTHKCFLKRVLFELKKNVNRTSLCPIKTRGPLSDLSVELWLGSARISERYT